MSGEKESFKSSEDIRRAATEAVRKARKRSEKAENSLSEGENEISGKVMLSLLLLPLLIFFFFGGWEQWGFVLFITFFLFIILFLIIAFKEPKEMSHSEAQFASLSKGCCLLSLLFFPLTAGLAKTLARSPRRSRQQSRPSYTREDLEETAASIAEDNYNFLHDDDDEWDE